MKSTTEVSTAATATTTAATTTHGDANPPRPPGPPSPWFGLPLLRAMKADYLGFTAGLRQAHGPITYIKFGPEHAYDLLSADVAREALVDNAQHLVRWERGVEVFEQSFGQSVLVTEGATWQRQRRMLMQGFTPKKVAGYADLMVQAAKQALDSAAPPGTAPARVDMERLFTGLTMDVILRTLFGSPAGANSQAAAQAVQVLSEAAMREMFWPFALPGWLPWPGRTAKQTAMKRLNDLVAGHIAQRRAETPYSQPPRPGTDLLDMLLALRDEENGAPLTPKEVHDQCMVTFQAGHETSATALLWWARLMAENPACAQPAQAEVDAALQGRDPSAQDLAALPWLAATLKEAMRLYPPVPAVLNRRTTSAITLGGWAIPKGALLRITPHVFHHDASNFSTPQAFQPERFMPGAPPLPKGAWMPFGAGPRVCLGQHFATLEMTLIAALALQRYDLALPADTPPAQAVLNVTLRPRGGLHLLLHRRQGLAPGPANGTP